MRAHAIPRTAAVYVLAALTAATLAAAGPPRRPADARAVAQSPAPVTRPYVRPADQWFGETRAVAVDGDFAYYSVGRAVAVADIGDPAGPRLVGRSAPLATGQGDVAPTPITDMAVSGRWLWAVTGRRKGDYDIGDKVALFDIQDPTRPQLRAYLSNPTERYFTAMEARGTIAVMAFYDFGETITGGLLAIRVDPSGSPYVAGKWTPDPIGAMPFGLTWTDDSLVVNGDFYFGRVRVIDAGDGGVRFEPAGFALSGRRWNQLAADGCRVYASEYLPQTFGDGEFTVWDVCADPPSRLGSTSVPFEPTLWPRREVKGISAATLGGRKLVFMTDAMGGMWTIDATDPTSMTWSADSLIEPVTTTSACYGDTVVAGSRLVVVGCGLAVLDMTDGFAMPQLVSRVRQPPLSGLDESTGPAIVAADDAILMAWRNTFSTIDWGAEGAPAVLGQTVVDPSADDATYVAKDIAATGDMVWTANDLGSGGVFGFDIRDRRRPVRVATLRDPGFVDAIAADGALLVTAQDPFVVAPIQLFDVSDPALPRLVGSIRQQGPDYQSGEMFLADGFLYVATYAGLYAYDVRDPSDPREGLVDAFTVEDTDLDAHRIVTLSLEGLRVYDRAATMAGSLTPVALFPLPAGNASPTGRTHFVDVDLGHVGDRTVAIVSNDSSLLAIDITDPAMPAFGVPYVYPVPVESIAVTGDRIYLVSGATADMWSLDLGVLLVRSILRLPFLANLGG